MNGSNSAIKERFYSYACFILFSLIPLFYFLEFQSYSYFCTEVIILISFSSLLGVVACFINRSLSSIYQLFLFSVFILISTSVLPCFHSTMAEMALLFSLFVTYMLIEASIYKVLSVMAITFVISLFVLPMPKQLAKPTLFENHQHVRNIKLPPIIDIILDEHSAISALPKNIGSGLRVRQQLINDYLKNGFVIDNGVYSHYSLTYNSISNLLNFTNDSRDNYYFGHEALHRSLLKNDFFNRLTAKGYQIRIYQTDYLDYCHAKNVNIKSCYTVPVANVTDIQQVNLSLFHRITFLIKSLLMQSFVYQSLEDFYDLKFLPYAQMKRIVLPQWNWYQTRTANIYFPKVLAKLQTDILHGANGTVFFVHLMAPHNPYIYNADCSIRSPATAWQINVGPNPFINNVSSREQRYVLYEQQVQCTLKQMNSVFASLKKAGVYDKAIIIIHGDHGSRITLQMPFAENRNKLTSQDLDDLFRTLFVYKIPGQSARIDEHITSLQNAFINVINPILKLHVPLEKQKNFVYLFPEKNTSQMPRLWVKNF